MTKRPGLWYRNFPAHDTLAPGASVQIPVAFADHIWTGVDQVRSNACHIESVRALYEQYQGETDWGGSVSSPYYGAAELLPRFGFRKTPLPKRSPWKIETEDIQIPSGTDAEDVRIIIR